MEVPHWAVLYWSPTGLAHTTGLHVGSTLHPDAPHVDWTGVPVKPGLHWGAIQWYVC